MPATILTQETRIQTWNPPVVLQLEPFLKMTDDELFHFCQINDPLRIERNADGSLVIMTPAGFGSSARNLDVASQLHQWAKRDGTGVATDSSGGYILPNRAMRAPDAAWIRKSRLRAVSKQQQEKFLPLCPDFAVELRSPSDTLTDLQDKMQEYIANGAQLDWLLDPDTRTVHVYRPNQPVEVLTDPETVSADPTLSGFTLDLRDVW